VPIPIEAATPRRASDPTVPADRVPGGAVATASGASCLDAAGGTVAAVTSGRAARWPRPARLVPGLATAIVLAIVATGLGRLEPVIGGPVFGIVFGMLVATFRPGIGVLTPGAAFAGRRVLQASIVVLGTGLSLAQVVHAGLSSLPVMLGTLALCLLVTWGAGRMLGLRGGLPTLIGVGTGICGASAIAATTAVIGAAEVEVAYAISTIFAFNVVAVLLYPAIGHLLGLSQHAFGLWSGTAINDTSSVVAAAYTYGAAAGDYGVVVKLTRTLMIIPICLGLAFWQARRHRRRALAAGVTTAAPAVPWRRMFPWFIAYFLAAVAANSLGLIPHGWHAPLSQAAVFLITTALVGIGLSTRFHDMRRTGLRPLALGAVLWATVGISSLLLQLLSGQL
jgi:uncharacterized integral membrane protein (TIGR00698 family)